MIEETQEVSFTIPLGTKAHEVASQSRQAICNSNKNIDEAEQAYINSLVVYAVNYYLKILGFEMSVKDIGTLECVPILTDTEYYDISPEVWSDRIGYIFVKLDTSLREAVILGFTKTPSSKIYLSKLQSVNDLIDYLTDIEENMSINIT